MGDPAPPRRRTHGGTGAGVLAFVKPLPPKAVAGRPGFTRAKRPRLESPPADRRAAVQAHALAPSLLPAATSPIRNSIEPNVRSSRDILDSNPGGPLAGACARDRGSAKVRAESEPIIEPVVSWTGTRSAQWPVFRRG